MDARRWQNDKCSVEAGQTMLAGIHLAESWAPRQTQKRHSIKLRWMSHFVSNHGKTHARVQGSIGIFLMPRADYFNPVCIKCWFDWWAFFSDHFSAYFQGRYDITVISYLPKQVSCDIYFRSQWGLDNTRFSSRFREDDCSICLGNRSYRPPISLSIWDKYPLWFPSSTK